MLISREFFILHLNQELRFQGMLFLVILIFLLLVRLFSARYRFNVKDEMERWKRFLGGIALVFASFAIVNTLLQAGDFFKYGITLSAEHDFSNTGLISTSLLVLAGCFYFLSAVFPKLKYLARMTLMGGVFWPLLQLLRLSLLSSAPSAYYLDAVRYFDPIVLLVYASLWLDFGARRWMVSQKKGAVLDGARERLSHASLSLTFILLLNFIFSQVQEGFLTYLILVAWAHLSFWASLLEWLRPISMLRLMELRAQKLK